jgi:hypothetical protein
MNKKERELRQSLGLSKESKKESKPKPKAEKKKRLTKAELEQLMIDNFINLQRVLTNLSVKFEDLSNNIVKFLDLFEISARSFAEKLGGEEKKEEKPSDKELLKKLDSLLDQNKTISKGIVLMEEQIRKRQTPHPVLHRMHRREEHPLSNPPMKSKPLPRY